MPNSVSLATGVSTATASCRRQSSGQPSNCRRCRGSLQPPAVTGGDRLQHRHAALLGDRPAVQVDPHEEGHHRVQVRVQQHGDQLQFGPEDHVRAPRRRPGRPRRPRRRRSARGPACRPRRPRSSAASSGAASFGGGSSVSPAVYGRDGPPAIARTATLGESPAPVSRPRGAVVGILRRPARVFDLRRAAGARADRRRVRRTFLRRPPRGDPGLRPARPSSRRTA